MSWKQVIVMVGIWLGVTFASESRLWQYGLWSFQSGDTKLERFLPKNQHIQRKLLNFELSKVPKFT